MLCVVAWHGVHKLADELQKQNVHIVIISPHSPPCLRGAVVFFFRVTRSIPEKFLDPSHNLKRSHPHQKVEQQEPKTQRG
jgi:hypothetical protein